MEYESKIIGTDNQQYQRARGNLGSAKFNGLYYYAKNIERFIIPRVNTWRTWNTVGIKACGGEDNMIFFVHNNLDARKYIWLKKYQNCLLVCGTRHMVGPMAQYGISTYLPLSIDIKSTKRFGLGTKKDQDACYMGNPWKFRDKDVAKYVPPWVHRFGQMPREQLLPIVAHYRTVYAMGLCAVEAQALGCEVKQCWWRYPEPEKDFPLFDCADAAKLLQKAVDLLDAKKKCPSDLTELA